MAQKKSSPGVQRRQNKQRKPVPEDVDRLGRGEIDRLPRGPSRKRLRDPRPSARIPGIANREVRRLLDYYRDAVLQADDLEQPERKRALLTRMEQTRLWRAGSFTSLEAFTEGELDFPAADARAHVDDAPHMSDEAIALWARIDLAFWDAGITGDVRIEGTNFSLSMSLNDAPVALQEIGRRVGQLAEDQRPRESFSKGRDGDRGGFRKEGRDDRRGGFKKGGRGRDDGGFRKGGRGRDDERGGFKKGGRGRDDERGGFKKGGRGRDDGGFRKGGRGHDDDRGGFRKGGRGRDEGGFRKGRSDDDRGGFKKGGRGRDDGGFRKGGRGRDDGGFRKGRGDDDRGGFRKDDRKGGFKKGGGFKKSSGFRDSAGRSGGGKSKWAKKEE